MRGEDAELKSLLNSELPQVQTVSAADSHLGMGHSLATGIRAVDGWQYAFVGLADMPFINVDSLIALKSSMLKHLEADADSAVILQPTCNGIPGHPVGFSYGCFSELGKLSGDRGAKALIAEAGNRLQRVELGDPGVLQDLDRPE